MNVRKPADYSAMFAALDTLMAAALPQMNLYCEIGRLVNARPEKGAAVAAAEYLSKVYPDVSGFSPRNLRRMRELCRAYETAPEVLAQAMTIGWTQNVAILENCQTLDEMNWYIQAVQRFGWTKVELLEKIAAGAHREIALNLSGEICYIKENANSLEPSNGRDNDYDASTAYEEQGPVPVQSFKSQLYFLENRHGCLYVHRRVCKMRGTVGPPQIHQRGVAGQDIAKEQVPYRKHLFDCNQEEAYCMSFSKRKNAHRRL